MLHHQVAQWCLVNVFFFGGGVLFKIMTHTSYTLKL